MEDGHINEIITNTNCTATESEEPEESEAPEASEEPEAPATEACCE
jgi:hypothetical protein